MQVSLNELDAMGRKAFRGAGYHWGEAEEAGKAMVWLAQRGLPVLQPALHLLERVSEHDVKHQWNDRLCPIRAGIRLSDDALQLSAGTRVPIGTLVSLVLFLPFVSAAAIQSGLNLFVVCGAGEIEAQDDTLDMRLREAMKEDVGEVDLIVRKASHQAMIGAQPLHQTLHVDPNDWQRLNIYAEKTYVPASERSRVAGAGAGLSDND